MRSNLFLFLALVILLTACGGGGDDQSYVNASTTTTCSDNEQGVSYTIPTEEVSAVTDAATEAGVEVVDEVDQSVAPTLKDTIVVTCGGTYNDNDPTTSTTIKSNQDAQDIIDAVNAGYVSKLIVR